MAKLTFKLRIDPGGPMAPMVDAMMKPALARQLGGMGAKTFNVHKDHVSRMGFGDAAQEIQDLFMAGKRDQAFAAVPDQAPEKQGAIWSP